MAGATISECPFPHDRLVEPITPCSVPSATDVWGVEVSMARTSTLARPSLRLPRRQEPLQPLPPPSPPNASARERQPPGLAVLRPKLHAEVLVGEQGQDGVPPFDEDHPPRIEEILQSQGDDLLHPIEPINIEGID